MLYILYYIIVLIWGQNYSNSNCLEKKNNREFQ